MIGHLNQSWHILSQYNDISNPLAPYYHLKVLGFVKSSLTFVFVLDLQMLICTLDVQIQRNQVS